MMQALSPLEIAAAGAELERLDFSATRHVLRVLGCNTVWREWGSGPSLVLLHGGHGSWMHWARNIDTLAEHFQVIVPDLPGFGDSEDFVQSPHDPQRLKLLLESLKQGIETLVGQAPMYLAGFSFGGAIAGMLAPLLPHLQRLAFLGCGGHGSKRRENQTLMDWRAASGKQRELVLLQNLQAFMFSSPHCINALALKIHAHSCEKTRFRSKAISRSRLLLDALQNFNKPVFMVWGENDVTAIPAEAALTLIQGKSSREWAIIPSSGHWVQFEKPDEVNQLLISWFKSY